MNAYYTNVRLYYYVNKVRKVAPAHTTILDFDDDTIEVALAHGSIRPATTGEAAEAEALADVATKKAKPVKTKDSAADKAAADKAAADKAAADKAAADKAAEKGKSDLA